MDQRPSPRYCFQTRTVHSTGHFSMAVEPYIPGMPTMKVPALGACETVAQFISRFNTNRYSWEANVRRGKFRSQVPSITRENMDKTRTLRLPKNVDASKLVRPSDQWIAAYPYSDLTSRVERGDYIRAEDLIVAFMNDPDPVVKYAVAHFNMDLTMYFLVESPPNNLGQSMLPGNTPQPNIPQPSIPQSGMPQWDTSQLNMPQLNIFQPSIPQLGMPQLGMPQWDMPQPIMQPDTGSPRPSLATQNQPQNLQSCSIPNDDPSVSNTSSLAPSLANNRSQLAATPELPSPENLVLSVPLFPEEYNHWLRSLGSQSN